MTSDTRKCHATSIFISSGQIWHPFYARTCTPFCAHGDSHFFALRLRSSYHTLASYARRKVQIWCSRESVFSPYPSNSPIIEREWNYASIATLLLVHEETTSCVEHQNCSEQNGNNSCTMRRFSNVFRVVL